MAVIPYGRQSIGEEECQAVLEVLHSDWLTQGPQVPAFEQQLAVYCGARHAVAAANGTAALHMACVALGVGQGDLVWTSPISFVASANCARFCGADVDFVDIDPVTRNMSVDALEEKLRRADRENRLPKVVIPVHFAGAVCDMANIARLGERYGFRIIEDAAHAVGSRYHGKPVGACQYSDIVIFSFHPVKTLTTAEGGAALTNDADVALAMRRYCSHGINRDAATFVGEEQGGWVYEMQSLGVNYRLTDVQAAMGIQQLKKLPDFVARRRTLVAQYCTALAGSAVITPVELPDSESAWHLCAVELLDADRRAVYDHMKARNILVNVHYIPIHLQPYYRGLGFQSGQFPHAEAYYRRALSLPLYPDLSDDQQQYVVDCLREALV